MGNKNIKKGLKKILNYFRKKYKPEKIILFGSRARGEELKSSDIDILVISKSFEKQPNYVKRLIEIYKEIPAIGINVDVLALTPKEFNERKKLLTIVKKAVEEGKVIYSA